MSVYDRTLKSLLVWPCGAVILVFGGVEAAAQTTSNGTADRSMEAFRLEAGESVALDGDLSEPVWRRARPATEFLQREPTEGVEPSERTETLGIDCDHIVCFLESGPTFSRSILAEPLAGSSRAVQQEATCSFRYDGPGGFVVLST